MDKMYNKSEELWSVLPYYDYKNEMSQEHRIWSIRIKEPTEAELTQSFWFPWQQDPLPKQVML